MTNSCWNPAYSLVLTNGRSPGGCLLNMTGGFPVISFGRKWRSTEALYQASRYTDHNIQKLIWEASNGWDAKQVSYRFIDQTRPDWEDIKVPTMYECLKLKYDQHAVVRDTVAHAEAQGIHIVEQSRKDDFWGAIPEPNGYLKGANALGRLWMFIGQGGTIVIPRSALPNAATLDEFFA